MKGKKRQLWWLLIPFVICFAFSGFQYSRYSRQKSAIRRIEELGGRVVTTHGDPRWVKWLSGGKSLRIFEEATLVNLSRTEVADSDLKLLHNLQGLQRLNLRTTGISDDGLSQIAGLTDLKALDLSHSRVSAKGLPHLRGLSSLKYLYLQGTSVTATDLQALQSAIPQCEIEYEWPEE